ncbi:Bestrophin, RFP-TM, chloride channel-domain-containing protein [Suillus cothurnatus]|nr:Bestrophin, RFP-TM, chloride channel-domain-containing protein [Suillus cothurnatus]
MSFNYQDPSIWSSAGHALLATALFRCWHILIFFGAWSTAICVISHNVHSLALQPTLITVFGTVLGFVISYRTTSSFERYNEGRRLWSQIVLGSRTFARTVWLHHFAIAVKHYLRGEDGIYYEDLYHLVKFLPVYALPPTIPSVVDLNRTSMNDDVPASPRSEHFHGSGHTRRAPAPDQLPFPTVAPTPSLRMLLSDGRPQKGSDDIRLAPAMNPPKYSLLDVFPFSLLVGVLAKDGVNKNGDAVKGRRAARRRAGSYVSALQSRKVVDAPTTSPCSTATITQLVDALTGLERILTTPIPFSYCIHLWLVTVVYCLALPFQLWSTLKWVTIPATVVASFIFFGFLVAGEEIESKELRAIMAMPTPDPSVWAFSSENDLLFASSDTEERVSPLDCATATDMLD